MRLLLVLLLVGCTLPPEEPLPNCPIVAVVTKLTSLPDGTQRVDTIGIAYNKTMFCEVRRDSTTH